MLRPGFSLVGLTGRLVSSRFDAPPGTLAVWVDWLEHGYTPENGYKPDDLPPIVNVPSEYVIPLGAKAEAAPEPPPAQPATKLRAVPFLRLADEPEEGQELAPGEAEPAEKTPEPATEAPGPRLRLL